MPGHGAANAGMSHGNVAPLATLCPRTLPRCNVRMKAVSFRNTRCHVRGRRAVADVLVLNAHVGSPSPLHPPPTARGIRLVTLVRLKLRGDTSPAAASPRSDQRIARSRRI